MHSPLGHVSNQITCHWVILQHRLDGTCGANYILERSHLIMSSTTGCPKPRSLPVSSPKILLAIVLYKLLLKLHTLYLEDSPLIFIMSIENSSGSIEGKWMMAELENKVFPAKSARCIPFKHHKEPCNNALETCKQGTLRTLLLAGTKFGEY